MAEIKCAYTELLSPKDLKPHPRNRNKHSEPQIKLLAKLIDAHGFRHPIIVSKLSGYITAGHGRLEAAQVLKMKTVPVDYQDFKDEAAEYQFLVSDNEVAHLAKTDLSLVLNDVLDFGPDFDMSLLGIPDFKLPDDFNAGSIDDQGKLDQKKFVFMECPHCGEKFEQKQARIIED